MKFFIKLLTLLISTSTFGVVYSASFIIDAPSKALSNRQPIVVQVLLGGENEAISGFGGDLSFPDDLFEVDSILTQGSVVSLWVTDPKISVERYLDGRKHINFEGIFPGGFEGVRSAYYEDSKPGLMFSVVLIPKNNGRGTFVIDEIELHSFNSGATTIASPVIVKAIEVPTLSPKVTSPIHEMIRVENNSLNAFVTRSELINRNAWYVQVDETESVGSLQKVIIAESENYNPDTVRVGDWREVKLPYVLLFQDRTKYIHVKLIYSNNTYALRTIPPVENSKSISTLSRILISVIALFALALFYGNNLIQSIRKKI